jgi:hypothetical protein
MKGNVTFPFIELSSACAFDGVMSKRILGKLSSNFRDFTARCEAPRRLTRQATVMSYFRFLPVATGAPSALLHSLNEPSYIVTS